MRLAEKHYLCGRKAVIAFALGPRHQLLDEEVPLGGLARLRYEWKNVFVDARYHFGITDVMKSVNAKNRYLSVNLGYRFEI